MPPLVINIPRIDRPEPPTKALVADRRLYLTRDEKSVVEEGDASAAFLLAACGSSIAGAEVDRLGLSVVEGRVIQATAETPPAAATPAAADTPPAAATPAAADTPPAAATPAETKDSQPDEDKQSAPEADKQAQPEADKQSAPAADKSDKSRREKK